MWLGRCMALRCRWASPHLNYPLDSLAPSIFSQGFFYVSVFFFFKQKTAYEIGLGIPAEPLFRSMISYLLVVEQHRTQIVIHALLKCQQENLYHEQNVTHI